MPSSLCVSSCPYAVNTHGLVFPPQGVKLLLYGIVLPREVLSVSSHPPHIVNFILIFDKIYNFIPKAIAG